MAALNKRPVDGVPNVPLAWANQPSRCNGRGTRDQHDKLSPRPTQHCSPCPESGAEVAGQSPPPGGEPAWSYGQVEGVPILRSDSCSGSQRCQHQQPPSVIVLTYGSRIRCPGFKQPATAAAGDRGRLVPGR